MAIILAAVTDKAREVWPKMLGGILPFEAVSYFKIGEGGWIDPGGGREPRSPAAHVAENDLDAVIDLSRPLILQRYAADERYVFQKAFGGGDLTFSAPSTLSCTCFVDFGEANNDGYGNDPEFWEIAVFDTNDSMLAYGTFPQQTKNNTVQITNTMKIVF